MIVRDKPSAWRLFFVMRGSIIPATAPRLAVVTALSVAVVASQDLGVLHLHDVAALPLSLIGIALSIFAGFRNSARYDRWWEARKVLGQLLVDARSLARRQLAHLGPGDPEAGRRGALRAVAHLLRGEPPGAEAVAALVEGRAEQVAAARNPPNMLLTLIGRDTAAAVASGAVAAQALQGLEERVVSLSGVLAAAGPWTQLVVLILSHTFFGLDAPGDEGGNPFGSGQNALPLSAMTRGIEIDVREMLGDPLRPAPLRAVEFLLT